MPKYSTDPLNIFEFHFRDLKPNHGMEYFVNERGVQITLTVSDEFAAIADKYLTRRGKAVWSAPLRQTEGERNFTAFLNTILARNDGRYFPFVYATNGDRSRQPVFDSNVQRSNIYWAPGTEYICPRFQRAFTGALSIESNYSLPRKANVNNIFRNDEVSGTQLTEYTIGGALMVTVDNHDVVWVRPRHTENVTETLKLALGDDSPMVTRAYKQVLLSPHETNDFMDSLHRADKLFVLPESLRVRLSRARSLIGVGPYPGVPADVAMRVGRDVSTYGLGRGIKKSVPNKVSMNRADEIRDKFPDKVLFHPDLDDIVSMRKAKPFKNPDLRPYQQEAVGLHLSTNVGYVQTCSPGMGKTVIQLSAMRERARKIENYRGLVVCEANVRKQWKGEVEKWFPEAHVVVLSSRSDFHLLSSALGMNKPVVVLMSYALTTPIKAYMDAKADRDEALEDAVRRNSVKKMKEIMDNPLPVDMASVLMSTRWHDLCADEAVVIRTGNSKQYQSMWALRDNADVAVPMSATPINTSIDDLLRLIAWARGNRTMFSGIEFPYDMSSQSGAKQMFDSMKPLIFRRDTSEIQDELPETKDIMKLLSPSAAEKALISAAESELKRCYLDLMAAMDELENVDGVDKDELKKARENLQEARGAWLGGKQLARIATSDASALVDSKSMGAALLQSQGLIEAAMQDKPTKMKYFLEEAQKRVLKGEKILVFTSFNTVADKLTKALVAAGINAKAFTGKNSQTRDAARVEFQNGEIDVLVSTKAGTRGLTLHRATTIFHYDIPYTLEEVTQRTGRGVRIGSNNKKIEVVYMIMADTIEHRVAEAIVEQGITASLVLDGARGRDLTKTETASTIGGLLGAATSLTTGKNKNVLDFGKILGISEKDLLSVRDLASV